MRSHWLSRLVSVVYPQHSSFGKLYNLEVNTPDMNLRVAKGLLVLRTWIREAVYELELTQTRRVLEITLLAAVCSFHHREIST